MSTRSLEHSSFLTGANSAFIEALYARYAKDPASVDAGWRDFFADLKDEAPLVLRALEGASWSPRGGRVADGNGMADKIIRKITTSGVGILKKLNMI